TDIKAVTQQIKQRTTAEEDAASGRTRCQQSCLRLDISLAEISHQCIDATEFERSAEDKPDPFRLVLNDGNFVIFHLIAEGKGAADPKALSFGGCDLVPDAL